MRNNVLKKSIWKDRKVSEKAKRQNGITLIALIVTMVVLLILASVTILTLTGDNGILSRSNEAVDKTQKQTAIEKLNLKITALQITKYGTTNQMPSLQEVADFLCDDKEIQYVTTSSKKHASTNKFDINGADTIYTKFYEYSYEFGIDKTLKLAFIDGKKIADINTPETSRDAIPGITKSTVLTKFNYIIEEKDGKLHIDATPSFAEGKSANDMYLYICTLNGKCVGYSTIPSFISSYNVSTDYKISIIGIDVDSGIFADEGESYRTGDKSYTNSVLDYPVLTETGIFNAITKCDQDPNDYVYFYDASLGSTTATDSLPIGAYDGNSTTYAGPYSITNKYIAIDPSAVGKSITITSSGDYHGFSWLDSSGNGTRWSYSRSSSDTLTVPAGKVKLKVYGNEGAKFYEIKINN